MSTNIKLKMYYVTVINGKILTKHNNLISYTQSTRICISNDMQSAHCKIKKKCLTINLILHR